MGVLCMLVRMLRRNGGWMWLLGPFYDTFILWGLKTSVLSASQADNILWFKFSRFFLFLLFRFASSARTRNLVVPAHRSLAMSQSFVVLSCQAWNALSHDMKILPRRTSFVSAVSRMVRGVDALNWHGNILDDSKNYQRICLLNVTYKVKILYDRLLLLGKRPFSITRLGSNQVNQQQTNFLLCAKSYKNATSLTPQSIIYSQTLKQLKTP
jgi:hypothetical protein